MTVGGTYVGVGGVYTGAGGAGAGAGFALCVAESAWKVEAPHFGQKEASGFNSALQLGQSVFDGASDLPQPEQNVSPAS